MVYHYKIKAVVIPTYIYNGNTYIALYFITHAPVHVNAFRGVRARYVKCTG